MRKVTLYKKHEILLKIKEGDERFLKQLYQEHRGRFIHWALKNHRLSREDAAEIYQRAFTILYFNFKQEKITTLNSSVETYLFGIGKNLILKKFQGDEKEIVPMEDLPLDQQMDTSLLRQEELNHQQVLVRDWLKTLGEPCESLLLMYYFKRFSMEAIAERLGYKNEGVAKKKKCLCLKTLRDRLIAHAVNTENQS